jgi:hypothetical protein
MEFEQFTADELPALIRYATMLAGDRELAQDVVQDAPIRANARWRRINGRPALEPTSQDGFDGYVNWQLPSGRWAAVRVDAGTYKVTPFQAIAVRVAESVRETRELVRTGFVPTYLPAGERIIGVSMDSMATGRGEIICASGPLGLRSENAPFEGVAGGLPADLGLKDPRNALPQAELVKVAEGVRWVG